MKTKLRNKAACRTTGYTAVSHKIGSSAHILIVLLVLFMCWGCCKSTSPDEEPTATIEILQNGVIQETFIVTEENDGDIYPIFDSKLQIGEVEIEYNEFILQPGVEPIISFFAIGRKNQSYSVFRDVHPFDTLRFDYQHDFDPINDSLNCGIMIDRGDGYIRNVHFSVWNDSIFVDSLFTDSLGRFETSIEPDTFVLRSFATDIDIVPEIDFVLQKGYADYFINYYMYCAKPNIYLYPENQIELDVSIDFPQTGEVVTSIPQYPKKWKNITVEPDGTIDGQYRFLFYESKQPNFVQRKNGWIVECDNLEDFFISNMKESGFIQPEIDDFIEYWIPILKDSPCFAIYPQYNEQLEPLIQLNFSKQPDSILRLVYVIEKLDCAENKFEEPEIPPFERAGFVVAEWGVVLD